MVIQPFIKKVIYISHPCVYFIHSMSLLVKNANLIDGKISKCTGKHDAGYISMNAFGLAVQC
jgi:hypothetical protein